MTGTVSGDPAWCHLAPLGDKLGNRPEILIIDLQRLIGAKTANLASKHRPTALPTFVIIRSFAVRSRAPFELGHISNYLFLSFR
jgi:hypothetical protein